ncbi:MAG: glycosyltransferase [bacterium]
MHILHVIDSLAVGGAERMLVDLANSTAGDGHQVAVCVTRQAGALAVQLRPEIPLWVLGRNRRVDFRAMRRFASLVTANGVDVLHAHGRSTLALLAMVKSLGLVRQPIVLHDHFGVELDISVPLWFRVWGRHFVAQYVGAYGRLAHWAKTAGVANAKVTVIENALDLSRLRRAAASEIRDELGIPTGVPVGIVVGGTRPEKGIDVLLAAVARSVFRHAMKILIVGGERDRAYARRCKLQRSTLRLEDAVLFLGERYDAASLMKGVDFAVVPSRSESGPLVLIEYLASGVPFVSTKVGAIAERVSELGVPEFVAPDDVKALADAMDRLLRLDRDQRRLRGGVGHEIAAAHFDVLQARRRWYAVYASALGGV